MVKIINERPPIWDQAHEVFEIEDDKTFYTYGDAIYNPAGIKIPDHVIEHEKVHMGQQERIGGPEIWWHKYLNDPTFRLEQELEAYGRQYQFICAYVSDRNVRAKYMWELTKALASPMYKVEITMAEANERIQRIANMV